MSENTNNTPPIPLEQQTLDKLIDINPLIKLYSDLHTFQIEQLSDEDLSSSIDLLKSLFPTMDEKEKSFLLSCFINSTAIQHKKAPKSFSTFMIRLYKLADAQDLILYRGKMQASSFLNVVLVCSGARDFDWTKYFIEKYQIYLAPTEYDDTLNLAWGYWNFHYSKKHPQKREFLRKAHEHLSQIPYSDLSVDLRLRSVQLRVFFELELPQGDREFFFDFTHSFEKWLRRTKILSEERKNNYLSYVLFARQLGKLFNHGNIDLQRLAKIRTEIMADEAVALEDWLLEKVEELKQLPHLSS